MTPEQFSAKIRGNAAAIQRLMDTVLPVKIGTIAQSHFKDNFRNGGFDGKAWAKTNRQRTGVGASRQYGPLLSKRNRLFGSISRKAEKGKVTIYTTVKYAAIHNAGGTISTPVTGKMRKFAWAKFYEAGGGGKKDAGTPDAAKMWRALALTKKSRLSIRIPKRQFMGDSEALRSKITKKIDEELNNILK